MIPEPPAIIKVIMERNWISLSAVINKGQTNYSIFTSNLNFRSEQMTTVKEKGCTNEYAFTMHTRISEKFNRISDVQKGFSFKETLTDPWSQYHLEFSSIK